MDLATRIERKATPSGDHRIWKGSRTERGVGQIRVDGKLTSVRRVVWELAHGQLPAGARVNACPHDPLCIQLSHLSVEGGGTPVRTPTGRARKGSGSLREVRPGTWELRVTNGRWSDGRPRTLYRTVAAANETQAAARLREYVDELNNAQLPADREVLDLTVDAAIELFLNEHLGEEKGRADNTINGYRNLHRRWFAPTIGSSRVRGVDSATIDRLFGLMRSAGLSRSQLNQARSLYKPFFRWAKRRGMITLNPMLEFELPTSKQVSRERRPPEVGQLSLLLATAVEVVPDVAPLLMLGAVTGMRRGELVGIRRSQIDWFNGRVTVDTAISESKMVKGTKTYRERRFHIDSGTIEMLHRVCQQQDERAGAAGVSVGGDAFLFSRADDGGEPMSPDYFTEQVAVLKGHLGIEDKKPKTVALEDEALRLRRSPPRPRPPGKTGPAPAGGMSYREIGEQLGRSERWANMAVKTAQRREAARAAGLGKDYFDGSILGLRKFTSSELLDAGFNIGMVAQRQGHGTQVLAHHYSKSRDSSDRKAAEHLGRVVHGNGA